MVCINVYIFLASHCSNMTLGTISGVDISIIRNKNCQLENKEVKTLAHPPPRATIVTKKM
jgi:hypothetical protein